MPEINIPLGPIGSAPWGAIRTELKESNAPVYEKVIRDALAGVELGAYDEQIVKWLAGYDCPTVVTLASLIYRVRGLDYEEPEVTS
jgi:hypothetical protein